MQHLYLKPKTYAGDGAVIVEGSLRMLGGPFMAQGDMQVHGSLTVRGLTVKGPLQVEGGLTVKGLPIFDLGKRMKKDEWKTRADLKERRELPSRLLHFVRSGGKER